LTTHTLRSRISQRLQGRSKSAFTHDLDNLLFEKVIKQPIASDDERISAPHFQTGTNLHSHLLVTQKIGDDMPIIVPDRLFGFQQTCFHREADR
jgi:hypothetical protein